VGQTAARDLPTKISLCPAAVNADFIKSSIFWVANAALQPITAPNCH
jgi:hypothetical protein